MMRHRTGGPLADDNESSSDDDAFSAFHRRKNKKKIFARKKNDNPTPTVETQSMHQVPNNIMGKLLVPNETSSNKRHHFRNQQRAEKLDALIQELQDPKNISNKQNKRFPDKMGSYVLPGEEHSTTNIFVGNLSPLTTEEQLTEIFRQFGELYSVKIMWPRTLEEQARGRNTGFVCFMNRDDAQDAMHALQDADPLNTGRRMFLNWGKNVKKMPKRGATVRDMSYGSSSGGENCMDDPNFHAESIIKDSKIGHQSSHENDMPSNAGFSNGEKIGLYNPKIHEAIRVVPPSDPTRLELISTVASFVAKDGSVLEKKLIKKNHPFLAFLLPFSEDDNVNENERIYYRWRVFSFCQGDKLDNWRLDPFQMIIPNGRFWIPPPIDPRVVLKRKMDAEMKIEKQLIYKKKRRQQYSTGRQIEHAKLKNDGSRELNQSELKEFNCVCFENLCGSKESICRAMAFFFDNSGAANQISMLLEKGLLDDHHGISVETKCARLYLMSDVLFNSQQPGVKNAFRYRSSIERMAPTVFRHLGQHGNGNAGRITMSKLRNAVKSVLSAWNSWCVYPSIFLDQLEALFEGKPEKEAKENNLSDGSKSRDRNHWEEEENGLTQPGPIDLSQKSIWIVSNTATGPKRDEGIRNTVSERGGGEKLIVGSVSDNEHDIENQTSLVDDDVDGISLGGSEMADSLIELDVQKL